MASYDLEMAYNQIEELEEDLRYLRAERDSLRHLLDMADEANEDLKLELQATREELESAYACIDDLNARLDNINIKG